MWKVETGRSSYKMSGMKFVFLLLIILSIRGKQTTIEEESKLL